MGSTANSGISGQPRPDRGMDARLALALFMTGAAQTPPSRTCVVGPGGWRMGNVSKFLGALVRRYVRKVGPGAEGSNNKARQTTS